MLICTEVGLIFMSSSKTKRFSFFILFWDDLKANGISDKCYYHIIKQFRSYFCLLPDDVSRQWSCDDVRASGRYGRIRWLRCIIGLYSLDIVHVRHVQVRNDK